MHFTTCNGRVKTLEVLKVCCVWFPFLWVVLGCNNAVAIVWTRKSTILIGIKHKWWRLSLNCLRLVLVFTQKEKKGAYADVVKKMMRVPFWSWLCTGYMFTNIFTKANKSKSYVFFRDKREKGVKIAYSRW